MADKHVCRFLRRIRGDDKTITAGCKCGAQVTFDTLASHRPISAWSAHGAGQVYAPPVAERLVSEEEEVLW